MGRTNRHKNIRSVASADPRIHGTEASRVDTRNEFGRGAYHDAAAASQNVGNHIGTRSSVRQSKLFRMYESGNATKALLGQQDLCWDVDKKQGAYVGHVYDAFRGQNYSGSGEGREGRQTRSD